MSDQMDMDSWIVGFINGEGSFYLRNNKCNFCLEHTDKSSLDLIKSRLDFGPKVSERSLRTKASGETRKPTFMLTISSKKDIKNLIDFIENPLNSPLQGNKFNQYIDWKKYNK